MKYITERFRRFCALAVGAIFFISGILKLLDPVGAGLVMNEYFEFMHIRFLGFASKPLGILPALAEAVIGTALITGVWRKPTAIAAMTLQGFFTILTLALVIFNPEMDCGCFGEAVHLTHMQTFVKNLIICALLTAAFIPFRDFGMPQKRKYVSFGIVVTAVLMFMVYSWAYIPLVDFTDYRPGAVLASAESSAGETYESVFVYEKDGVRESFTLEHLPDSSWTFVSAETVLKDTGAAAPVSLSIKNREEEYVDQTAAEGDVIIISVYDPESVKAGKEKKIRQFAEEAEEAGFTAMLLSTSGTELQSDYKTLLTLNRSNGGATYFKDGKLICKWAYRALPDKDRLEKISRNNGLELAAEKETRGSLGFQGFLLYVFAVMLLL